MNCVTESGSCVNIKLFDGKIFEMTDWCEVGCVIIVATFVCVFIFIFKNKALRKYR